MLNKELKLQIIDLTVSIVLFVIACFIGKIVLNRYNTLWTFSVAAILIVIVGEFVWWTVRKKTYVCKML